MFGMDKVLGRADQGMDELTGGNPLKGMHKLATAPLAKFGKGGEDKAEEKSAAPVVINIINMAKGDSGGVGASASASASGSSASAAASEYQR